MPKVLSGGESTFLFPKYFRGEKVHSYSQSTFRRRKYIFVRWKSRNRTANAARFRFYFLGERVVDKFSSYTIRVRSQSESVSHFPYQSFFRTMSLELSGEVAGSERCEDSEGQEHTVIRRSKWFRSRLECQLSHRN